MRDPLGPISENQSASAFHKSHTTASDNDVLRKIANGSLKEAESYQHIIRLIIQCADLRRRLEERG